MAFEGDDLLALGLRATMCASQKRKRRAIDIAVHDADACACLLQRECEVDRGRALPNATLARSHRDHAVHAWQDIFPGGLNTARGRALLGCHVDRNVFDTGECTHPRVGVFLKFFFDRARGGGEFDRERNVAAVDRDVLHKTQVDDALVKVRVDNGMQGIEDLLFSDDGRVHAVFLVRRSSSAPQSSESIAIKWP